MKKKIDLYVTVTSFDSDHLIKGKITFRKGITIRYTAKRNRTEIIEPKLLVKEEPKINNRNIPILIMKNIKEGIKDALLLFLEKRNNPNKIEIPDISNRKFFTSKMYAKADKTQGSKMIQFEVDKKEYLIFFTPPKEKQPKAFCQRPRPSLMQQSASN